MRKILLLLALLATSLALPRHGVAQGAAAGDSAFLRPGDVIRLQVFRQAELSGEFVVSPEGTIQHPLLSNVVVVGASRSVIRERLREALSRFERDPAFVFDYLYRVAVGGEVHLPNLYPLNPETTIGQAVAAAGGVTEFGRLDRVHVLRDGQDIIVDLRRPDGNTASMRIRSGDQIRVSRRGNVIRDVITPFAAVLSAIAAVATFITTQSRSGG